jgi:hypothetical protein
LLTSVATAHFVRQSLTYEKLQTNDSAARRDILTVRLNNRASSM